DSLESAASVMRQKPLDVLKEKSPWPFGTQNPREIKKERSASVSEAKALSGDGESLTGKAADEEVEAWRRVSIDLRDVPITVMRRKVTAIKLLREGVNFAVANALVSPLCKRQGNTTDTGEGVEILHAAMPPSAERAPAA